MPALPTYLIEPIWERFAALLPGQQTDRHPIGCHRLRVPDRVAFEKLVQVLVFGCRADEGAPGPRPAPRDLLERQAGSAGGDETLGRRAHEPLAKRPQEVGVVYRAQG